jgi:hypothetical protein
VVAVAEELHGMADVGESETGADRGGPLLDGFGDDLDGASADPAHEVMVVVVVVATEPVTVLAPFVVGQHVERTQGGQVREVAVDDSHTDAETGRSEAVAQGPVI